jgi:hypothetical protein
MVHAGAINQAKTGPPLKPTYGRPGFKNTYVNPNYKPPSRNYSTPVTSSALAQPRPQASAATPSTAKKDVVISGVQFVSSGRSLVRKDSACSTLVSQFRMFNSDAGQWLPPLRHYARLLRRGRTLDPITAPQTTTCTRPRLPIVDGLAVLAT